MPLAPHEPGHHLCQCVPSVAGSGLLMPNGEVNSPLQSVAPRCIGVRRAWNALAPGTGGSACATRDTICHSSLFGDDGQAWYAVKIFGVVRYKRAGILAGAGRDPGILGGDRLPPPPAPNLAPPRAGLSVWRNHHEKIVKFVEVAALLSTPVAAKGPFV